MEAVAEWGMRLLNDHAEWALFLVLLFRPQGIFGEKVSEKA